LATNKELKQTGTGKPWKKRIWLWNYQTKQDCDKKLLPCKCVFYRRRHEKQLSDMLISTVTCLYVLYKIVTAFLLLIWIY